MTLIIVYTIHRFTITFIAYLTGIGIGANLFLVALTKDFKSNLNQINEMAKVPSDRSQIMEKITEYVEFHSTSKQLSKH